GTRSRSWPSVVPPSWRGRAATVIPLGSVAKTPDFTQRPSTNEEFHAELRKGAQSYAEKSGEREKSFEVLFFPFLCVSLRSFAYLGVNLCPPITSPGWGGRSRRRAARRSGRAAARRPWCRRRGARS